jgi:hypothetical protein
VNWSASLVEAEQLGAAPPADHRLQRLLGVVRRHVVLQLVAEPDGGWHAVVSSVSSSVRRD